MRLGKERGGRTHTEGRDFAGFAQLEGIGGKGVLCAGSEGGDWRLLWGHMD